MCALSKSRTPENRLKRKNPLNNLFVRSHNLIVARVAPELESHSLNATQPTEWIILGMKNVQLRISWYSTQ